MSKIPENITESHINTALKYIDENGIPEEQQSTKFDLVKNGKRYPPKLVIRRANVYANGEELWDFSGGAQSNRFLEKRGFNISPKTDTLNTNEHRLNQQKFKEALKKYLRVCSTDNWLSDNEAYKFHFANWLFERVDFENQNNEEILAICLNSQEQKYTLDSSEKGINFIKADLRYKDSFISLKDIEIFRYFCENEELPEQVISGSERSYPKLSVWLGTLFPEYYVPYARDELIQGSAYLFNLEKYPKNGYNSFVFVQSLNNIIKQALKSSVEDILPVFKSAFGKDTINEVEWSWLTQDLNLFISWSILSNRREFETEPDEPYPAFFKKEMRMKTQLNRILYGPPGTGKTYQSIDTAVSIIENLSDNDLKTKYPEREDIKAAFEEYRKNGQIAFVTFHQSFTYEDFVEGIKPRLVSESDTEELTSESEKSDIAFEIKDGIFKSIAQRAADYKKYLTGDRKTVVRIPKEILEKADFYKMSLGNSQLPEDEKIYQYCIANNCVAMGWGEDVDFTDVKDEKQLKEKLNEYKDQFTEGIKYTQSAIKVLKFWMKKNDIVVVSNGNTRLRAIGLIDGEYFFDTTAPIRYSQFRKVKWLYYDIEIPVREFYPRDFSQQTIYGMYRKDINDKFFLQEEQQSASKSNYVLIIDEINRGNIAQIFGELITLIEPDKRAGQPESLSVLLPYSKTSFSVPDNLYIIGTMNTADRSVEALDTALRRRFNFTEISPKPELLESFNFENIDLVRMLTTVNRRIEKLIDKDHCIGHSYFMKLKDSKNPLDDLKSIFRDKIIPLLQEYFYGDFGKIGLLLGKSFVEIVGHDQNFSFADFEYENGIELQERSVYRLKPVDDLLESDFIQIYDPNYDHP